MVTSEVHEAAPHAHGATWRHADSKMIPCLNDAQHDGNNAERDCQHTVL
jgi:hypothetical protein